MNGRLETREMIEGWNMQQRGLVSEMQKSCNNQPLSLSLNEIETEPTKTRQHRTSTDDLPIDLRHWLVGRSEKVLTVRFWNWLVFSIERISLVNYRLEIWIDPVRVSNSLVRWLKWQTLCFYCPVSFEGFESEIKPSKGPKRKRKRKQRYITVQCFHLLLFRRHGRSRMKHRCKKAFRFDHNEKKIEKSLKFSIGRWFFDSMMFKNEI